MTYNENYWNLIEKLVHESKIIIDRPKGACHPKFQETIYEVDYGYLDGTTAIDGEGIDVFVGSGKKIVTGISCSVDLVNRDIENIILIGCTDEEKNKVLHYLTKYENMQGIIIDRPL